MRSSGIILVTAIGLAAAACSNTEIAECGSYIEGAEGCGSDDFCACNYYIPWFNCYEKYCPGVVPDAQASFVIQTCLGGTYIAPSVSTSLTATDQSAITSTFESVSTHIKSVSTATTTTAPSTGSSATEAIGAGSTSTAGADMLLAPAAGLIAGLLGVIELL